MLQLFVSVSLDSLKQRRQCQLLCVAKLRLLLLNDSLHLCLELVSFELFKEIGLHLDPLSLVVPLEADELGLSVSQFEQILAELHLGPELLSDLLLEGLELKHMLFLELLEGEIRRRLIITHIVVPSL